MHASLVEHIRTHLSIVSTNLVDVMDHTAQKYQLSITLRYQEGKEIYMHRCVYVR